MSSQPTTARCLELTISGLIDLLERSFISNIRICCFSVFYVFLKFISLNFLLLVEKINNTLGYKHFFIHALFSYSLIFSFSYLSFFSFITVYTSMCVLSIFRALCSLLVVCLLSFVWMIHNVMFLFVYRGEDTEYTFNGFLPLLH